VQVATVDRFFTIYINNYQSACFHFSRKEVPFGGRVAKSFRGQNPKRKFLGREWPSTLSLRFRAINEDGSRPVRRRTSSLET